MTFEPAHLKGVTLRLKLSSAKRKPQSSKVYIEQIVDSFQDYAFESGLSVSMSGGFSHRKT